MGLRRPRRVRARHLLVLALCLAGLAQGASGGWIFAKAALAQVLLDRAWAASVAAGTPVRPWPWADTWPVARLRAPRLGAAAVVLAGASGEALAFGPGLVDGSARPGAPGNAVIAGHRDTHFAFLAQLREGDVIAVEDTAGRRSDYAVVGVEVVDSRDAVVSMETTEPWLTLVACWPFGTVEPGGPLRYVVTARKVAPGDALPSPARSAEVSLPQHADDPEQDQRADGRHDHGARQPAHVDPEHPEDIAADEGADHAHDDVAHEAEAASLHQLAGEPTRQRADDQEHEQTHSFHTVLPIAARAGLAGPQVVSAPASPDGVSAPASARPQPSKRRPSSSTDTVSGKLKLAMVSWQLASRSLSSTVRPPSLQR